MKIKKYIITAAVITVVAIVIVRLVSVKQSFSEELKMVSESNTTVPVITDTVKYRQMTTTFSINGTFSPSQEVSIAAETQGKIVSINSKTGDKVVSGQVLASIDNELFASQLNLAKFNLEKAEKDKQRFEKLSKGDAATIEQYESAKQVYENALSSYTIAKVQNENARIKAPFDGIITKRYAAKGTYLSPGTAVFDIVSINKVKLIAKLTDAEVQKIKKDQNVKFSVEAYPGITYDGKVTAIIIKADLSKRYDAEIEVDNHSDQLIKPGMFGTVVFSSDSSERALIIPRKAIAGSIKNAEVFLLKGDSVNLRKIVVTPFDDKYVVVSEGLKVGDVIVTSGQISLVNGSKIKLNN